jgi:hypothetical protein
MVIVITVSHKVSVIGYVNSSDELVTCWQFVTQRWAWPVIDNMLAVYNKIEIVMYLMVFGTIYPIERSSCGATTWRNKTLLARRAREQLLELFTESMGPQHLSLLYPPMSRDHNTSPTSTVMAPCYSSPRSGLNDAPCIHALCTWEALWN